MIEHAKQFNITWVCSEGQYPSGISRNGKLESCIKVDNPTHKHVNSEIQLSTIVMFIFLVLICFLIVLWWLSVILEIMKRKK